MQTQPCFYPEDESGLYIINPIQKSKLLLKKVQDSMNIRMHLSLEGPGSTTLRSEGRSSPVQPPSEHPQV